MNQLKTQFSEIARLEKELFKLTGKVVTYTPSLEQSKIKIRENFVIEQLGIFNPYYQDCGFKSIYIESEGSLIINTYSVEYIDNLEPKAFYKYTDSNLKLLNIWIKPEVLLIGKHHYGKNNNLPINSYYLGDNKYPKAIWRYINFKHILSLEECILHARK